MNLNISEYRNIKLFIISGIDIIFCVISVWLAFSIRLEVLYIPTINFYFHSIFSVVIFLSIFLLRKNYSIIFRLQGINDLKNIFLSWMISFVLIYFFLILINFKPDLRYFEKTSISIIIIQQLLFGIFLMGSRFLIVFFLMNIKKNNRGENVAIYGAGFAGQQFLKSLSLGDEFKILNFIDDNERLKNNTIDSIKIIGFEYFKKNYKKKKITKVFITIPSINGENKNKLINKLENLDIEIKILPSLKSLTNSKINYSNLKDVEISDILDRDIKFNYNEVSKYFKNKNILVTGAGGSIGKEICKQISNLEINKLILVDNTEFNLFQIEKEITLNKKNNNHFKIITKLVDITHKEKLITIFKENEIDILFHAAAYKHVDLLERNPMEAFRNNLLGTSYLVELSDKFKLNKMILISTDKAVYPSNIMGLTKRLSELFIQSYSKETISKTVFSSVRFGNVLGSSGSVIPIFQNQIKKGGPVTVTDKNVTRFFMTIPEAVKLILESSYLAKNNEIYFLDMGKPHNIYELAKKMIRLNGLKISSQKNNGIRIIFTGLKKGEKMAEQLSYSDPKIFSQNKNILIDNYESGKTDEILKDLNNLINLILAGDQNKVLEYSKKIKIY